MLFLYAMIKARRKEIGISQAELGRRTGYSQSAISKIEQGKVNIPSYKIMTIAEALYTTPNHLTGYDEKIGVQQ